MTGQIPDHFIYNDKEYSLVGLEGDELFFPQDYGMETKSPHTACWRGYVITYGLLDNKLVVKNADIFTDKPKAINNVKPKSEDNSFKQFYQDVNLELKFTGSIIIACDFIQERYVHMGFQSPSSFRDVHELTFKDGILVEAKDISEDMETRRNAGPPKSPRDENVDVWIQERFSLDPNKD